MCNIHRIEEVCTTLTSLEGLKKKIKKKERKIYISAFNTKITFTKISTCSHLRNKVIMVGQVCTAVDTAVAPMTGIQIGLKSFGLGLLHHV